MAHVFLSYRHQSATSVAEGLHRMLLAAGVPTWRDVDAIEEGTSITEAVARGLDEAVGGVIVFTGDYLESVGCFLELASLVSRFHDRSSASPLLVVVPDGDVGRIAPALLKDARSAIVATAVEPTRIEAFAEAVRGRAATATVPGRKPSPEIFGTIVESLRLVVPCGHERAFWRLHDLAHADGANQTKLGLRRPAIGIASVAGGGAIDLMLSYAELLGARFPGGVFFVRDGNSSERRNEGLREIGDLLGLQAESLHAENLERHLADELQCRGYYLWLVIRSGSTQSDAAAHWPSPPSTNGRAVVVFDGLPPATLEPHVTVGPLSRQDVARLFRAALGLALPTSACDALHSRTGGHLRPLKGLITMIESVGVDIALARLAEMSDEEVGRRAYAEAIASLSPEVRGTLLAFATLPPEVAVPNAVLKVLFAPDSALAPASASRKEVGRLRYEHLIHLQRAGAIAMTPDKSGAFVTAGWRAAATALATRFEREASVLAMTGALVGDGTGGNMRSHAVRALLQVMPSDNRRRRNSRLPQLLTLGSRLLATFESDEDCLLAIRCAAVHLLYGEHDAERRLLARALEWARTTHGDSHPLALDLDPWVQG